MLAEVGFWAVDVFGCSYELGVFAVFAEFHGLVNFGVGLFPVRFSGGFVDHFTQAIAVHVLGTDGEYLPYVWVELILGRHAFDGESVSVILDKVHHLVAGELRAVARF